LISSEKENSDKGEELQRNEKSDNEILNDSLLQERESTKNFKSEDYNSNILLYRNIEIKL
jgi:hypothetical protein